VIPGASPSADKEYSMTIGSTLTSAATLLAILAMAFTASIATAQHDHGHDDATPGAHDGHMAATPGHDHDHETGTGTGVIYLTIANTGDEDDALLGATTDRARAVEMHETKVENDIGTMLPHDGPLVIPAGESVSLEPAGLHIMLVDLNEDIRLGDTFEVTLEFERAGEVTIPVTAVLDAEDVEVEPVEAGELEISGAWSRPAPRIDNSVPATAEASPAS
jgi:periplasmic copper chaperone A